MRTRSGCNFQSTQHTGDFLDTRIVIQRSYRRCGLAFVVLFADLEVLVGLARHLWQVRNAQHLPILSEATQQAAYHFRHATAYAAIDFIEDQCRRRSRA